jgi:hypothetical protein
MEEEGNMKEKQKSSENPGNIKIYLPSLGNSSWLPDSYQLSLRRRKPSRSLPATATYYAFGQRYREVLAQYGIT